MNILIFSNCPVVESQGSGYVIANTVKALKKLGHTVDMISPEELIILPKIRAANIYRMAIGMAFWVMKNKKRVSRYDRIIYYGGESYLALFLIKSIFRLDVPVILHSNGLEVHVDYKLNEFKAFLPITKKKWYHFNSEALFRYCYNRVDAIITVSDYDRDFAIKHLGVMPEKVFTLEPALPEIYFKESALDYNRNNIITFCGSWIVRKGIESIKNAIPEVLRANPSYTFRLVGVGSSFNVSDHFPSDILDRIVVYPFVTDKQTLIDLYCESQIFLFPSFCESFGLVVVEAMFCGNCVITGPTGVASTLLDGIEALVLNIPDHESVVEAINKLIVSPSLRVNMAQSAHKRVDNLQWSTYTEKLENILANVPNQI